MMIKVSDYIAELLKEKGISKIFTLTGGGAMHLNDSFGHAAGLDCIYVLHEQAAAIAAEAYARVDNKIAAVCVTTGPGGTNAMTGVLCGWLDNVPMLIISGQVKTSAMVSSTGLRLRQYGEQEYNIVDSVRPMAKYAVTITNPKEIKYHLFKAIDLAMSGRRGPCWIDVPLDIQGMRIDPSEQRDYIPVQVKYDNRMDEVLSLLANSKTPVILAGSAIRTGEAYDEFLQLADTTEIPIVAAKSVADLLPVNHPNYYGNFGINGGRAGNFILQNADCMLVLGCRLSFGQIGFNYKLFSPNSKKIVVEVDGEELRKETVSIDCKVNSDLRCFLREFIQNTIVTDIDDNWLEYCRELRDTFPIYQDKFYDTRNVNAYYFGKVLLQNMKERAICVVGNSCSSVSIKQLGVLKKEQRMWGNINCGTMGYDIPASIGACVADKTEVICCAGDGSFQMNIQELQTVVNYDLPIKFFVFNNGGYRSIILSQSKNFGRLSGCESESGLRLPKLEKIAAVYGMKYFRCDSNTMVEGTIRAVLHEKGPVICEMIEDPNHAIEPKLGNIVNPDGSIISPSLEVMQPPLDDKLQARYTSYERYVSEK